MCVYVYICVCVCVCISIGNFIYILVFGLYIHGV